MFGFQLSSESADGSASRDIMPCGMGMASLHRGIHDDVQSRNVCVVRNAYLLS